jgi:hypothetical protein
MNKNMRHSYTRKFLFFKFRKGKSKIHNAYIIKKKTRLNRFYFEKAIYTFIIVYFFFQVILSGSNFFSYTGFSINKAFLELKFYFIFENKK